MGSLKGEANTRPLAHALATLILLLGLALVSVPGRASRFLVKLGPIWPRVAGALFVGLSAFTLFALHVTYFW
jgi:hypothetical protein